MFGKKCHGSLVWARFSPSCSDYDGFEGWGVALISKALAELRPRYVQRLGEDAGLSGDGHEVGVAAPAWERVQMDVRRDAGAGCLAQIQAEVESSGGVD